MSVSETWTTSKQAVATILAAEQREHRQKGRRSGTIFCAQNKRFGGTHCSIGIFQNRLPRLTKSCLKETLPKSFGNTPPKRSAQPLICETSKSRHLRPAYKELEGRGESPILRHLGRAAYQRGSRLLRLH